MSDRRVFRVDGHLFRLAVANPSEKSEVLHEGRWEPLILTTEDVLSLMNVVEVSPEEARELGLPD